MIAGVGVDLVRTERIAAACVRFGERFLNRCFSPGEQAACAGVPARLAARYAAKEAIVKALGTGLRGFAWRDVEIGADALGRPTVALHGGAANLATARGIVRWDLSLSHDGDYAIAFAVASGADMAPAHGEGVR